MKRRNFIRNVAISSGALLLPRTLFSFAIEKKLHVVIIGDRNLKYKEMFCEQYSISSVTSIGWDEEQIDDFSLLNAESIEFDFSSITVNHTHPLDNSVILPQRIRAIFKPKNNYLIVCSLYKREALLSKEIINYLEMKQVEYKFFGSMPILNPRISPWTAKVFSKYDDNPKVMIYDANLFLNKLQHENGQMLFSDFVVKCDDRLVGKLSGFYKSSVG